VFRPDSTRGYLFEAIRDFQKRERRFGGICEDAGRRLNTSGVSRVIPCGRGTRMQNRSIRLVVGLAVITSVALVVTPAAATTPVSVSIHVVRDDTGDHWTAEGAIVGSGTFVDDPGFFAGRSETFHVVRTFTDAEGTFSARGDVRILATSDPAVFDVVGRWAIVSSRNRCGAPRDRIDPRGRRHGRGDDHRRLERVGRELRVRGPA